MIKNTIKPWEDFHQALRVLAANPSPLKERLENALIHLALVNHKLLPKDIQEDFKNLKKELTKVEPLLSNEGSIHRTVTNLSDDEAMGYADKIISMYECVLKERVKTELRELD